MAKYTSVFEQMVKAAENTGDSMLNYYQRKQEMLDQLNARRERQQLISDVADEVIKRLNITVDASDVIDEIDDLRRAIDSLGK